MRQRLVTWGALAIGIALFVAALLYVDLDLAADAVRRMGPALPVALALSALWHLARTWAWSWCFPQPCAVSFLRLARVRLAAEAFSYLTLRGIAGEPLKVVLLADRVDPRAATAAVALERIAYLIVTILLVGGGSMAAILGLPLTRAWFRVFRAFAIASGVIAVVTALVITGRGTYLEALFRRLDKALGTSMSTGRVGRFVSAVEAHMLALVRGHRRRLLVLLTAAVSSYICMALEAWVVLRASGASISLNAALAVETFSRVASFASALIPANIGALEASSLAAVAAVGASGGAALAIARRLRGLFWAALGLAIFPRNVRPHAATAAAPSRPDSTRSGPTLLYFPETAGQPVPATTRIAGLAVAERVIRSALRAGYATVVVCTSHCTPSTLRLLRRLSRSLPGIELADGFTRAAGVLSRGSQRVVTAVGPGTVVSPALLESAAGIAASEGNFRDVPAGAGWEHSGVLRVALADAECPADVLRALRARAQEPRRPSGEDVAAGRARLALQIETTADLRAAEQQIRRSSYKHTDNTLARFNRRLSLPISVALIRTPLTANQLSVLLVVIGFYSAWLFSTGHYLAGVIGALLSLAASILDGCDGEIARLKYQESALGCWIETFGDYSYYVAIFAGLTVGAVRSTGREGFYWIGAVALCGTLLSFAILIYLRTRITAGRPERLHAIAAERFQAEPTLLSRLIWRLSFTATRSAMPYGIFAVAVAGRLPAIVVLAAIGSTIYWISLAVKLRALLGAESPLTA